MEPQTSYRDSWDALRKEYRQYWIVVLTYFPMLGFLLAPSLHLNALLFLAWPCWAITWIVISWRIMAFHCPRCGQSFFHNKWIDNSTLNIFFTRRCLHCRLPKWSDITEDT